MNDLDNVKDGKYDDMKKNDASRWAANDIISRGGPISGNIDLQKVKLDPRIKDKLIADQARIN